MTRDRRYVLGRPAPPFWFLLLLCALEGLTWRALGGADRSGEIQYAFWAAVFLIASAIWTGVQVAGKVTLTILAWSVKALWAFAIAVNNGAVAVGKALVNFGSKAWQFIRLTYDEVLKPAWQFFWKWFDRLRRWIQAAVGPVLDFLDKIRQYVLGFYETYVRPILDAIGIARRVLNVLASLGLDWARALDQKLRWLEEKIDAPFRLIIQKLNEIVDVIDRVVTLDGLFQRVAYIRTLERDMRFVGRAFVNWRSLPLTPQDFENVRADLATRSSRERIRGDFESRIRIDGAAAATVREHALIWEQAIRRE